MSLEAQTAFSDARGWISKESFTIPAGQEICFFLKGFRRDLGPTRLSLNRTHSPQVKRPKHEADH